MCSCGMEAAEHTIVQVQSNNLIQLLILFDGYLIRSRKASTVGIGFFSPLGGGEVLPSVFPGLRRTTTTIPVKTAMAEVVA